VGDVDGAAGLGLAQDAGKRFGLRVDSFDLRRRAAGGAADRPRPMLFTIIYCGKSKARFSRIRGRLQGPVGFHRHQAEPAPWPFVEM
jgi:hypothetical protein